MNDDKMSGDYLTQIVAAAYAVYCGLCKDEVMGESEFYDLFISHAPQFHDLICGVSVTAKP